VLTKSFAAFRDNEAGSYNNRSRPVEEDQEVPRHGGRRDDRGARVRNDRHSRTGHTDTNKQIEQGWGSTAGEGFLNDEKAAEAIAQTEENESSAPPQEVETGGWGGETGGGWGGETTGWGGETAGRSGENAGAGWGGETGGWGGETGGRGGEAGGWGEEEKEPADKAKTYAEYLAELAEKRREDLGVKAARAPNEGVKPDKKWQSAKEFKRDEDEEQYIRGKEDKARRERQRKEKNYLDVDMRFVEPPRGRGNGRGRGRGRGGRGDGGRGDGGRGEGGRGDRGDGGRWGGDGGRGDRGDGDRGDRGDGGRWGADSGRWDGGDGSRGGGGRSASGPTVNVHDKENFPTLGAW